MSGTSGGTMKTEDAPNTNRTQNSSLSRPVHARSKHMKTHSTFSALNQFRSFKRVAVLLAVFACVAAAAATLAWARPDVAQKILKGPVGSVGKLISFIPGGAPAAKVSPARNVAPAANVPPVPDGAPASNDAANDATLGPIDRLPLAPLTSGNLVIYRVGDG